MALREDNWGNCLLPTTFSCLFQCQRHSWKDRTHPITLQIWMRLIGSHPMPTWENQRISQTYLIYWSVKNMIQYQFSSTSQGEAQRRDIVHHYQVIWQFKNCSDAEDKDSLSWSNRASLFFSLLLRILKNSSFFSYNIKKKKYNMHVIN